VVSEVSEVSENYSIETRSPTVKKMKREEGRKIRRWKITDFTDFTYQQWRDFPMKSMEEDF
jgi:hypothetical protein